MRRFLLDSNSLTDCIYRRRGVDQKARAARARGDIVGTSIPVAAEVLGGVEYSDSRERNLPIVERGLRQFRLWPFEMDAAREYARLFAELRRRGRPFQTIDLMVAAIARCLGTCTVVTCDSDFDDVPDLRIENWAD